MDPWGKNKAEQMAEALTGFRKKEALVRDSSEGQTLLWALDSNYSSQRD